MTIIGIHHIQIAAPPNSEQQTRQFWGELVGLKEIPKPPNLAGRGGVWFQCGSQELHIGIEADFQRAQKAHPAFQVADLMALHQRLTKRKQAAGIPAACFQSVSQSDADARAPV